MSSGTNSGELVACFVNDKKLGVTTSRTGEVQQDPSDSGLRPRSDMLVIDGIQ